MVESRLRWLSAIMPSMRILTVIPISRGISKDTLTYFTKNEPPIGSIVSIPLRNKTVYGLVVGSKEALELKSELKKLAYSIKKIDNIESRTFLSDSFIESAKKIADYNAGSVGAVLSMLIPKAILEESAKLPYILKEKPAGVFHETLLLQTDDVERYSGYKSLIREEFAKNRSIFFCLPTTEDLLNAKPLLEKGIENYTYVFYSGLSKKELSALWREVLENEHPVLIIAIGSFLSIPRNDLGTIIVEKESSRAYKTQSRPFIDIRTFAEILAKELGIRLILGDTFLRIETLWEEKNGRYSTLSPLKFRQLVGTECEIINMRTPQDMKKKEFAIFDDKLKKMINSTRENNEHTFLFCGRKGLYPVTVCSDCGTVVVCKNCSAPVILYGKKDGIGKNLFVCNHCGERREANELCIHCRGWRLNPMGIGIERVAEEVLSISPGAKIIVIDKDNIKTHKQAVKARDLFYNTPGSIMVGTEMALAYLNQKVQNTAVVSIDSYFSIPDFQINEKIFHILLNLRALAERHLLVQTRQENTKILDYALRGNLIDFYRDEIDDRKKVEYPPFATYIKITIEGERGLVRKKMEEIAELVKPLDFNIYDAWNPGTKIQHAMHGLISLPKGKWVDETLLAKLRGLPQQYLIRIDPITLL